MAKEIDELRAEFEEVVKAVNANTDVMTRQLARMEDRQASLVTEITTQILETVRAEFRSKLLVIQSDVIATRSASSMSIEVAKTLLSGVSYDYAHGE